MKLCFFGSEDFSLPILEALVAAGHTVVAVVTRADKIKGRGHKESSTIVAEFAEKLNIPVLKPESFKDGKFSQILTDYNPEINVVCSYGKILNTSVLACPLKGCINVHPSLLPKYRGATPIESALRNGDSVTGVTIFYMDEGCDTGDIILQETFPIEEEDNRGILREKLSHFSAVVLLKAVAMIENNIVKRLPQSEKGVCGTFLIKKEDLFINWDSSVKDIINFGRSLSPEPGIKTYFRGKQVGISSFKHFVSEKYGEPGVILDIVKNIGPIVAVKDGAVSIVGMKPEGRKFTDSWSFCCGNSPKIGEKFGL